MAATNSSVLACSYAISGAASSEFISKHASMAATPISTTSSKLPAAIKCQKQEVRSVETANGINGRRAALLGLAAALFATAASSSSSANAGVIDDYLEKSKANKVCMYVCIGPLASIRLHFAVLLLHIMSKI